MIFSFIQKDEDTLLSAVSNGVIFEIREMNQGYVVAVNDTNTFLSYDSLWDNLVFSTMKAAKEFCSKFSCLSYNCIKVV